MIEVADLVMYAQPEKAVGTLTFLKLANRTKHRIGNRSGLVLEMYDDNVLVDFEGEIILVHKMFLKVISESR
ncbi:MAG: hypothetical protein CBB97_00425 [Candidatus Endolissoclinum sp. TMED37]|nr:MAG: hypothetical protein CBB97_00425 [Candidatus Endolissoclinum sp. TMED37]|tara:strand:- start:1026 stop:1241 length:216 start_codon:yes stop_codon:yes gene_type:complete